MIDLTHPTLGELLRLHGAIGDALIARGVVRTGNNPCADLAETLCCRTFDWVPEPNNRKSFDAIARNGDRIQIKARRITARNPSRKSGALRKLEERGFERLAGIVFDADYRVLLAFEMPVSRVLELARHSEWVKGATITMSNALLDFDDVIDLTPHLSAAAKRLLAGTA